MPLAPTDIRSLARKYTEQAIETLVHVMRAPQAPPAARVLAANSLLDRGWGKAAQLVAVDGEIRPAGGQISMPFVGMRAARKSNLPKRSVSRRTRCGVGSKAAKSHRAPLALCCA